MPSAPRDPEVAALVAFDLYTGSTVPEAAAKNHVSRDTVRQWQRSDWWPDLMEAVAETYLDRADALARGALIRRLEEGDAISARWLLERRDRKLAPPSKVVEVTGHVNHVAEERKALAQIPTDRLERALEFEDDEEVVDAVFEEANP